MILEPIGVFDPFVSSFVGDQQLKMLIPKYVNKVDGVFDPFTLYDSRRLEDQEVLGIQANQPTECMRIIIVRLRGVLKIQKNGKDHRRDNLSQGQYLLGR